MKRLQRRVEFERCLRSDVRTKGGSAPSLCMTNDSHTPTIIEPSSSQISQFAGSHLVTLVRYFWGLVRLMSRVVVYG